MSGRNAIGWAIACILGCRLGVGQEAKTVSVNDDAGLRRAIAELAPGVTIALQPGDYRGNLEIRGMRASEARPIVIRSADVRRPARIVGGAHGIHLAAVAHIELRDLVFERATANGLNVDDGGVPDEPSHHVVLRNLIVRDAGSDGNHDGIKLSGVADFRVEGCTLERWGTGGSGIDMVGCHRGLIVQSTFRHIGDQLNANGVQAKGGSADITIRGCRFEHAGGRAINLGGSTGSRFFRPKPGVSAEASGLVVEDCTIVGSMAAVAFVGVDGAVVRRNVIYRPRRWVIRILQENQEPALVPCRNGQMIENIIVFRSDELATAVNVGGGTQPATFTFSANRWYCSDRPGRSKPALPVAESGGVYGEDPKFKDPERGDFTREGER